MRPKSRALRAIAAIVFAVALTLAMFIPASAAESAESGSQSFLLDPIFLIFVGGVVLLLIIAICILVRAVRKRREAVNKYNAINNAEIYDRLKQIEWEGADSVRTHAPVVAEDTLMGAPVEVTTRRNLAHNLRVTEKEPVEPALLRTSTPERTVTEVAGDRITIGGASLHNVNEAPARRTSAVVVERKYNEVFGQDAVKVAAIPVVSAPAGSYIVEKPENDVVEAPKGTFEDGTTPAVSAPAQQGPAYRVVETPTEELVGIKPITFVNASSTVMAPEAPEKVAIAKPIAKERSARIVAAEPMTSISPGAPGYAPVIPMVNGVGYSDIEEPEVVDEVIPEPIEEIVPEVVDEPVIEEEPLAEPEPVAEPEPEVVEEPVEEPAPVAPPKPARPKLTVVTPDMPEINIFMSEPEEEPAPVVVPEPAVIPEPEVIEEPSVEEESVAEPEPEVIEELAIEEEPVAEPEPEVIEEPAIEEEPVAEPEPEVIEEPVIEEEPVAEPEIIPEPAIEDVVPEPVEEIVEEPVIEEEPVAEPEIVEEPVVEEVVSEPTEEPASEPVAEPEIPFELGENEGTRIINGQIVLVHYRSSFMARLIQADADVQDYYTIIKNLLLSYKGVKARCSWNCESFNKGRVQCAKMNVKGRTITLYLALDPKEYEESKYHFTDVSGKPKFAQVPMLVKVRSDRALKYAVELIEEMMAKLGIPQGEIPTVDYHMPYETTEELVDRDLVKVILPAGMSLDENANVVKLNVGELIESHKSENGDEEAAEVVEEPAIEEEPVAEPEPEVVEEPAAPEEPVAEPEPEVVEEPTVEEEPIAEPEPEVVEELAAPEEPVAEPEEDEMLIPDEEGRVHVDASHADTLVTDEEAESEIEEIKVAKKASGKLVEINIDTICENFEDGETVTLEALKAKKLVNKAAARLKVLARGVMTKNNLEVIADKFSIQAVKMIILAGGKAEKVV